MLIDALLGEAARQSVTCVCLFTRIPDFFGKMGFTIVEKELLPDKMYKDCLRCPRLHACDEIAMYMGELPEKTVLSTSPHAAQYYTQLVSLES
jgi:amino-acid N-acetyltransferase